MRVLLLALLVSLPLAAQDTESLSGSVPGGRRLNFRYSVDFGPTIVNWTVACNINTPSSAGIVVRLIDVDALAANALPQPNAIDEVILPGAGTANASLSGSYDGAREFVVEIESAGGGSSFSGDITTSAGSLSLDAQDQIVLSATGLKTAVERFAFWDGTAQAGAISAAGVELDFGPTQQTRFVRFEGIGSNIEKLELLNTTGGSATVLATFFNPGAGDVTAVPVTGKGTVYLRVNAKAVSTQAGSAAWALSAPGGITLRRVGSANIGGTEDADCTTGTGKGRLWLLAGLGALAMLSGRYAGRTSSRL